MEKTHKEKLREAGIRRHGNEKAWREFQRVSAKKASMTTPRGFTVISKNKELHSEISKKGAKARWDKYYKEQAALEKNVPKDNSLAKS